MRFGDDDLLFFLLVSLNFNLTGNLAHKARQRHLFMTGKGTLAIGPFSIWYA